MLVRQKGRSRDDNQVTKSPAMGIKQQNKDLISIGRARPRATCTIPPVAANQESVQKSESFELRWISYLNHCF
jgi:hypothetical protein